MNRSLPPYATVPSAWAGLSPEQQADLGCTLIEMVLAEFVQGDCCPDEYQYCTQAIRDDAAERAHELLNLIDGKVREALPDLFGPEPGPEFPDGGDPAWAWRDRDELLALRDEITATRTADLKRLAVVEERLRTFALPAPEPELRMAG